MGERRKRRGRIKMKMRRRRKMGRGTRERKRDGGCGCLPKVDLRKWDLQKGVGDQARRGRSRS